LTSTSAKFAPHWTLPLEWAQTQNNLGLALLRLGERENSTARLEEAVAADRDALKERTRERVPLEWAMSSGNQGVALMWVAQRKGDDAISRTAVLQIEASRDTLRAAGDSLSAEYFEKQLQIAKAVLEQVRRH